MPEQEVTQSAFTKARKKFSHSAFIELNQGLNEALTQRLPLQRWHGLRLLAVDGSKLRLPNIPALGEHFGTSTNATDTPCPQALYSTLYDVLNHFVLDAQVARYDASERDLALAHLNAVGPGALVLFDRGYPAFWLFAAMIERGIDFCVRLPWNLYKASEALVLSGARERCFTLHPSAEAQRDCAALGLSTKPLTLRLVRVALASGETEVLLTSLRDTERFPAKEFQALYHYRWGIEEAYKRQKHPLALESFSGHSVEAILQDIHARVLTYNLTALLAFAARPRIAQATATRRHVYQVNWTRAFSKLRHTVLHLLLHNTGPAFLDALVAAVARDCEAVRPDRTFPRKGRRSRVNGRVSGYKPTC